MILNTTLAIIALAIVIMFLMAVFSNPKKRYITKIYIYKDSIQIGVRNSQGTLIHKRGVPITIEQHSFYKNLFITDPKALNKEMIAIDSFIKGTNINVFIR